MNGFKGTALKMTLQDIGNIVTGKQIGRAHV